MENKELLPMVQLAMQKVNVIPFSGNRIAFGTNSKAVDLSSEDTLIAEAYLNTVEEKQTVHLGFTCILSAAVQSTFQIEVDGARRPKTFPNTNSTVNFTELLILSPGLHHIAVTGKTSGSMATVGPREAKLGVYL